MYVQRNTEARSQRNFGCVKSVLRMLVFGQ